MQMADPKQWTCPHCADETQTDQRYCQACQRPRYASWAIQVAEHVTEHLEDGLSTPLEVLAAMEARGCYKSAGLTLAFISQQMRILTKDTTTIARQLVKARAARTMLEVLETGDTKDKISVLAKWGPDTNAEHVDHAGTVATTVTHVYEEAPAKAQERE